MKMLPKLENQLIKLILYGGAVLLIITSKVPSILSQNIQGQHQTNYVGKSADSGEVISARSPVLNEHEPSCEELRAMWRFSKRQSRAAEISNELPTYRDPFIHNIWDPYYPAMRGISGSRISTRYRDLSRPVFGRILHKEPSKQFREAPVGRPRSYKDISRTYSNGISTHARLWGTGEMIAPKLSGGGNAGQQQSQRRRMQFRFAGSAAQSPSSSQNLLLTPQKGSFQRLKELIWTERARELAEQRKAEEMIARAAVLKEIANGQSLIRREMLNVPGSNIKPPSSNYFNGDVGFNMGLGNRIGNGMPLDASVDTSSDFRSKFPFATQSKQTYRKSPKRQLDQVDNQNEEYNEDFFDDSYSGSDDINKNENEQFNYDDNSNKESLSIFDNRLAQDLKNGKSNFKYNNYKISLPQSVQIPNYQAFQNSKPRTMETPNNRRYHYRNERVWW